jgi:hypothetical protein
MSNQKQTVIDEVMAGSTRLLLSEIELEREAGSPINIRGPGMIEINAGGKFEYLVHVSAKDYNALLLNSYKSIRPAGSLFKAEDFFRLTAKDYSDEIWTGRVLIPQAGGIVGSEGVAFGTLDELRSRGSIQQQKAEYVTFYVSGVLRFPQLHSTVTQTRGKKTSIATDRNYTKFSEGPDTFTLSHQRSYTEIHCKLRPGSIAKYRHIRMQEALSLALGQFVWPRVTRLQSDGQQTDVLLSPSRSIPPNQILQPPLHFSNFPPVPNVYEIAAAYYRKLFDHVAETPHPISEGVSLLMQGLRANIEVQVVALAVAAEMLIKVAFPDIVPVTAEFKKGIEKFQSLLKDLSLLDTVKERLKGSANAMLQPRNADRIHAFVSQYGLERSVFDDWKNSRNPSVHGTAVDYSKMDEFLARRWKVLYLCHAIVLAHIGYAGPHTRYDLPGHPTRDWNPKPKPPK